MDSNEKILDELLSFQEKLTVLINHHKKEIHKENEPLITQKSNKKQKTVMFTPSQIEKGELYAKQLNMSFSELIGYLIDHAEYSEGKK